MIARGYVLVVDGRFLGPAAVPCDDLAGAVAFADADAAARFAGRFACEPGARAVSCLEVEHPAA